MFQTILQALVVWSKISNVLKRLGFRSRDFFAQLLSETSTRDAGLPPVLDES
jgi:hypothetical protein